MKYEVTCDDRGRVTCKGRGGIVVTMIASSVRDRPLSETFLHTLQLRYPRFIHSELMTHRVFSRNAASSRAIPVAKMLEQVRTDPAMPIHWGKNQPGMQANAQLTGESLEWAKMQWLSAAQAAANYAKSMSDDVIGLHKQVANRILEPFQFMHTIVSATDWWNFFELRAHPDAQPEFQELAYCIKAVIDHVESNKLAVIRGHDRDALPTDKWHLPYVLDSERALYQLPVLLAISAARCARVSYLTHDGEEPTVQKDIDLFGRLVGSKPLHASPIEHQARPMERSNGKVNNFRDWIQFRHTYNPADPMWKSLGKEES
jgi:thymidylate synthase ThyX